MFLGKNDIILGDVIFSHCFLPLSGFPQALEALVSILPIQCQSLVEREKETQRRKKEKEGGESGTPVESSEAIFCVPSKGVTTVCKMLAGI